LIKLAAIGAALVAAATLGTTQGAATAAPSGAQGCPNGQVCVDVRSDGVLISAIPESVIAQGGVSDPNGYQVRADNARALCTQSEPITDGTALWQVLQDAGVTLGATGHVTVQRPSGEGEVTLTAIEAAENGGGAFLDGEMPLFWGDGPDQQLNFARPLLAAPPPCPTAGSPPAGADSNAADIFFTNRDVTVDVYSGPILSVRVHPSVRSTPPRREVTFHATVVGGTPSGARYRWDFGNGVTRRTGANSVTYGYPPADTGVWSVTVQVIAPDGSEGDSRPVTMTVTSPSPPKPGGKHGDSASRGAHPAADTTSHASTGSDNRSGHAPGAAPGPIRPGLDTTGATGGVSAGGSGMSRVRTVAARHASMRVVRPTGTVISGQLLGDAQSLVSMPTTPNLRRGSAPAVRASAGARSTSRTALGFEIIAVIVLVAAGALRELRDRRR
jgi:hypothetical protein